MKSIDVKSMLIGFLLCACGFLLTGYTSGGSYQISGNPKNCVLVNTATGETWSYDFGHWGRHVKPVGK